MSRFAMKDFASKGLVTVVAAAVLLVVFAWFVIEWTYNRIYVPVGYSLQLRYKGPPLPLPLMGMRPAAERGQFAKTKDGEPLELGILEEMVGPGRHFYCPLWWERKLVEDQIVKPGEVGIVTSRMGENLPEGEYLVDGDLGSTTHKGILRKAFGPGTYRVNPYAYEFKKVTLETINGAGQKKHAGWVEIPTGFVGVVTNLADNPLKNTKAGIQENVLPPGLYPINPREQHIDIVQVGYREKSITVNLKEDPKTGDLLLDESGEPVMADDDSGITFPSNDGFTIHMDFTAVWGIMPDQAPDVIRKFGNVEAVETKVVIPQIESICRNMGSTLGAVDLLVGDSRQKFQTETANTFKQVLDEKGVTLHYGLVRHIYIPHVVRQPIQQSFIADELKLTREQEQLTAETEALLREAEEKVKLATQEVRVETEKLVAEKLAEGKKVAEETKAETLKLVAAIDRQTAELEAEATVLLGEAEAKARQMQEEAKAEKFQLAVDAFGTGEAYNQWVFATGLPDDIELNLLYAGEGTFWTDLKGFTETMLARQIQQSPGAVQETRSNPNPVRPTSGRPAPPRRTRSGN